MSIWTILEYVFVAAVGFHAALFVWLAVRMAYGFLWSLAAYGVVVSLVLFLLDRISP